MNRVDKIWMDLNDLTTDAQVVSYWEKRQKRILDALKTADSSYEPAANILHQLAKSLNEREQYSAVFYLFKAGYQPLENKLPPSDKLNEVKFEFGRGLHHNRKYEHAKRLFNELASTNFDTRRIEGWWTQTAFASTRDRMWLKTDVLPAVGRFAILFTYVLVAIQTEEFLISTTVFIIVYEFYEALWYHYWFSSYLKEYEDLPEVLGVKKKLQKKTMIELGFSLLVYPIYLLKREWLMPLAIIVAIYFLGFHYALNLYYFPKIVGELNRKKSEIQPPQLYE